MVDPNQIWLSVDQWDWTNARYSYAPKPDQKQPMVVSHCNRKMQPMHCLLVILALVLLLASDKNTASGANFRVKKDLRKGLRAQQATKQGEPWMDGAQDYPDLQVSDEAPTPDIASPDQKYDDPMAPPVWLAHKDLEPPGLPQTPPPPPPEMPPPMYEAA